ncbi:hypothetical protein GGR57DRAFT_448367 [Xylariaceae sp. FL1272]|nr:hypothetical protein GGR57DRAFT_448367 [Xylariaceae sp. FL1272]
MLTSAVVNIQSFFYPIGNTPAISLTQSIPPDDPANILLLGCGDVRNILFTVHNDRKLCHSSPNAKMKRVKTY